VRAIQISEFGGPEVLQVVELPDPQPAEGEVLIKVRRAGLNYADTHQRTNSYLSAAQLPLVPGTEVAGVRVDTGERVVALTGTGGYAEIATAPASLTFPIPDEVDDETALAVVVQGLTAWHLYTTAGRVVVGDTVVVHAAAGGVGSIAVQLGKSFGAGRVIGTASSEEKRRLALELGADAATDASAEGMAERLVECNDGNRVDVVFEMSGGGVFDQSMKALGTFGRMVVYGMASGTPSQVVSGSLMLRSQTVTGFWLVHCLGNPKLVDEPIAHLFARASRGELRAVVGGTYPLSEAGRAHTEMQARRTSGKLLLDPSA
jgi:NADPH2:quinone reductase